MSNYDSTRVPSEFLASLNAIPSAIDVPTTDDFNFDTDLAMFTNTTFFDFDAGQDLDITQPNPQHFENQGFEHNVQDQQLAQQQQQEDELLAKSNMEFLASDFSFPDFSSFQHAPADVNGYALAPAAHVNAHGLPQLQTAQHAPLYPAPTDGNISPANGMASPHSAVDNKRKADAMLEHSPSSHGMNYEDASRLAAEEDKRRRNTAASARFRVKKKQREQALEKSAKEMSDKVAALESRINQLETENKWLKNLVMEKNNKEGEGKEDLAALWKKFSQENAAVKTTGVKAETKA